jgi:hypothetical protein
MTHSWKRQGLHELAVRGRAEHGCSAPGISDVNLFRYCRGVIYFDAQIPDRRPLRAVRVEPIAGPPLLVCPNQQTYSDTVQVENEPRAGAPICA